MQCLKEQYANVDDVEASDGESINANLKHEMLQQEEQLVDGKGLTKINTMVSLSDAPMKKL